MDSSKPKKTSVLLFILIIIMILGMSSMVLVYRLGTYSQSSMVSNAENLEYALQMVQLMKHLNTMQMEKLFFSKDSVSTDTLISQLNKMSEITDKYLLMAQNFALTPEDKRKIEALKGGVEDSDQIYDTLHIDDNEIVNSLYQQIWQQFENVSVGIAGLFNSNLTSIINRNDQQKEIARLSVIIIFVFTGVSFLLVIASGVYLARSEKRSEKKVDEVMKEKDSHKREFLSRISHELKTSISVINLSIKILNNKQSGELNNEQQELLTLIQNQSARLLKILNETAEISEKEDKSKLN